MKKINLFIVLLLSLVKIYSANVDPLSEFRAKFNTLLEKYGQYQNNLKEIVTVKAYTEGSIPKIQQALIKLGTEINNLQFDLNGINTSLGIDTPHLKATFEKLGRYSIQDLTNFLEKPDKNIRDEISRYSTQINTEIGSEMRSYFVDNFPIIFSGTDIPNIVRYTFDNLSKSMTIKQRNDLLDTYNKATDVLINSLKSTWEKSKTDLAKRSNANSLLKTSLDIVKNLESLYQTKPDAFAKQLKELEPLAIKRLNTLEQRITDNLKTNKEGAAKDLHDYLDLLSTLQSTRSAEIKNAIESKINYLKSNSELRSFISDLQYSDNPLIKIFQKFLDTIGLGSKQRTQWQSTQDTSTDFLSELNRTSETAQEGTTTTQEEGGQTQETQTDRPEVTNYGYEEDYGSRETGTSTYTPVEGY